MERTFIPDARWSTFVAAYSRSGCYYCFILKIAFVPSSELHDWWKRFEGIWKINSDQWLCSATLLSPSGPLPDSDHPVASKTSKHDSGKARKQHRWIQG
jgi:hypothetical protein